MERYLRQVILPEIGYSKQKELAKKRVLVIGVGALGGVISVYLAAFGVGYLRLVDFDKISISNLHRQVFYKLKDIGKEKTKVIKEYINEQNPEVVVDILNEPFGYDNFEKIIKDIDIIVDGTDRLSRKFLIADISRIYSIPWVFGSIYRFEGMVAFFDGTFCLRCVFDERYDAPSCEASGVFTPVSSLIASLQTSFTLKYLLNLNLKRNTLFVFDLLSDNFFNYKVKKKTKCLCANKKELRKNLDKYKDIEISEIKDCKDSIVFDLSNYPSLKNNNDIDKMIQEIRFLLSNSESSGNSESNSESNVNSEGNNKGDKKNNKGDKKIVFACKRGEKSLEYSKYFRNLGFNCFSLKNGLNANNNCFI